MKRTILVILAAFASCCFTSIASAQDTYEPSGTYMFASKDSCELFLDIYNPTAGSVTSIDGIEKPTVIFMFGGGFMSGSRNEKLYLPWYRQLNEAGYRVVAIDYRLGLKGVIGAGINPKFIKYLRHAMDIAVEDLFSATNFLVDNAQELGIDPSNLVISGSSAGAMTSLQAEWEICNSGDLAAVLPEGFNYAGVMSFSGAIFSDQGSIKFKDMEPCPIMLCHGTIDKIVPYSVIAAFNLSFSGTDDITAAMKKDGHNYVTYRFLGHGHDIAVSMSQLLNEETDFLEVNVMKKSGRNIDATIDDPRMPVPEWAKAGFKDLFKKR